MEHRLHQLFRH